MRRVLVALLLGLPLSCSPKITDFSGVWKMTETDVLCRHEYSTCWVAIEQQGDRAVVHSWGGDGWKCSGRGVVEGTHLRFRWGSGAKDWNGTADLERTGNDLRGTYQRDERERGPAVLPRSVRAAGVGGEAVSRRGFTLIQLLFVIGVIAVLAALIVPGLESSRRASNERNDGDGAQDSVDGRGGFPGERPRRQRRERFLDGRRQGALHDDQRRGPRRARRSIRPADPPHRTLGGGGGHRRHAGSRGGENLELSRFAQPAAHKATGTSR